MTGRPNPPSPPPARHAARPASARDGRVALGLLATAAIFAVFIAIAFATIAGRARESGYPDYSSLNANPSGVSLFFDSLAAAGVPVDRQYDPAQLLAAARDAARVALFYVAPDSIPPDDAPALLGFARRGGRLVILMPSAPEPPAWMAALQSKSSSPSPPPAAKQPRKTPALPPVPPPQPTIWKLLAADVHSYSRAGDFTARANELAAQPANSSAPSPEVHLAAWPSDPRALGLAPLSLRDNGYLDLDSRWTAVYSLAGRPVLATRPWGRGAVVLASTAAFLRNDRFREIPHLRLALWLVNGGAAAGAAPRRVLVDEIEHGLGNQHGLSWLLRRYHLGAGLWALAVLFALALWRAVPSLLPPLASADAGFGAMPEKAGSGPWRVEDVRAGYVRLLRRAIPPSELIAVLRREAGLPAVSTPGHARRAAGSKPSPAAIVAQYNGLTTRSEVSPPQS